MYKNKPDHTLCMAFTAQLQLLLTNSNVLSLVVLLVLESLKPKLDHYLHSIVLTSYNHNKHVKILSWIFFHVFSFL